MPELNTSIKCSVKTCKHHDQAEYCQLNEITIGGEHGCSDCRETECKSFKCK